MQAPILTQIEFVLAGAVVIVRIFYNWHSQRRRNRDLPSQSVALYSQPNVSNGFYHNAFYCSPAVYPDIRLDRVIPEHFFPSEDSTTSP